MERYDLLVVGAGAAGINAVKIAMKLGASVALVGRRPLGGTCVNRGPSHGERFIKIAAHDHHQICEVPSAV